jgi:nicotinamidase-related amidase
MTTALPVRETLADVVDPAHTALLVIDVQKDFYSPDYQPMVDRLERLLAAARAAGVQVVYIQNTVLPDGQSHSPSEIARRQKLGMPLDVTVEGTPGQQFVDQIAPRPGELVVRKHRLNSFVGTSLEMLLRARGVETIICTGVATHGCVLSTAYGANSLNYYVVVADDCVATWDQDVHAAALHALRATMQFVVDSEQIAGAWAGAAVGSGSRTAG